jgi:hypothetical protein
MLASVYSFLPNRSPLPPDELHRHSFAAATTYQIRTLHALLYALCGICGLLLPFIVFKYRFPSGSAKQWLQSILT